MTTTDNGVNVQALLDAREVLKGAPEAAQFTWRASSKWQNGVHSTTTIQNFFGLGEEQSHKTETVFDADHPEVFAAEDNGITPIEYLLVGLASCLTAGVASVAQNRGIQLRSVESTVEGNARHPRHPRRRQRRPQRLQRHQGDVQHRRRRLASRRSRRWWPSRRSAPPCSTPSPTRRTSPSRSPEGPSHRARHHGRHRRRPRRPRREPLPQRPVDRPRRARARRGGELLAARALGLAAPAHAQLAEPPAGPSLRRPGSRRLHDDGRGGRVHRALRRASRGARSAPARTSRRCDAPTTATDVRDEPRRDPLPGGGHRQRRLQPAGGAGVQRRGAGVGRAADAVRLPQPRPAPRRRRARRRRVGDRRAAGRRAAAGRAGR